MFLDNYEKARKKLKEAEEFSDINSGTEIEETLKKTRRHRAAKKLESDTDESSDDNMTIMSQIPKIPNKTSTTAETKKTLKNIKNQDHKGNYDNIIIKIILETR